MNFIFREESLDIVWVLTEVQEMGIIVNLNVQTGKGLTKG
jgi:hypothetical protein